MPRMWTRRGRRTPHRLQDRIRQTARAINEARIQRRCRGGVKLTPEELDALVEKQKASLPPPPAAPTLAPREKAMPAPADPFDQFERVLRAMNAMESVINKKIEGRLLMQQELEQRITERLKEQFANMGEGSDPHDAMMNEGLKMLIGFAQQGMSQAPATVPPAPNPKPITAQTPPQTTTTTPPATPAVQEAPKEVSDMTNLTEEQINAYADQIYEHFPKEVLNFQKGIISREQAVAKIMQSGCPKETAERIAQALLDTEYPEV